MSERQNGLELVAEAITEYYGERCDEDEPGCPCCDVWAWFDAACARTDWQPIETAPKDGTEVMLWGVWAGEINGVDKTPSGPHIGYFIDGSSDYAGDDWWVLSGGDAYATWCRATHWKLIPEPPK